MKTKDTQRIIAIEQAYARSFPGIENQEVRGWLLRAGDGITERSNSAAPISPAAWEQPLPLRHIESFYRAHGLKPCILIPDQIGVQAEFLLNQGWVAGPEIMTMYRTMSDPIRVPEHPDFYCRMSSQPDTGWLDMYHFRGQALPLHALNLLRTSIDGEMVFASLCSSSGQTVAITRATLTRDHSGRTWLGYSAVEVHSAFRRRGLGTLLGQHIIQWGAHKGARHVYLQVLNTNEAGVKLYKKLEFRTSHMHRYISPDYSLV